MSRVELARIKSLTFYQDSLTEYRRTSPLPQLVCVGKPCSQYTPEVVRCESLGGVGTEVDWKCEADLPEALRFGKVEVSCEGWSGPGDPYVLKGSCSLEYRLVHVPGTLRNPDSLPSRSFDIAAIIFNIIWVVFLVLILYSFFRTCFRTSERRVQTPRPPGPRPGSSGWFPGGHDDDTYPPPPPYSKHNSQPAAEGWRPGFWTGAALGGLGTHFFGNRRQSGHTEPRPTSWDWERDRAQRAPVFGGRRAPSSPEDRGEGSSNLGSIRRSTGLGGSNVR